MVPRWTALGAACILAMAAAPVEAQSAAADSVRSTRSGVYSEAQAGRGQETFAGICTGCHVPASHTGVAFTNAWADRKLSELFEYISEAMPKSDPGSLSPRQYADLVAYLLKLNGMPAGRNELPADPDSLSRIRIDTTKTRGGR
jgi:mono/diheme cytochrome c family protein